MWGAGRGRGVVLETGCFGDGGADCGTGEVVMNDSLRDIKV